MSPHQTKHQEDYYFAGGTMTVLVPGSSTDGRYALLHARVPAGNATPWHLHDAGTELLVVLDGAITAETLGRAILAQPGDVVSLPPCQAHRLSNAGPEDAAYLMLCVPSGFERFVRIAGQPIGDTITPAAATDGDGERRDYALFPGVRSIDDEQMLEAPLEPARELASSPMSERFEALGASVEVLATLCDVEHGIVLLRATPASAPEEPAPRPGLGQRSSAALEFFAATIDGGVQGQLGSAPRPSLLIVTTSGVTRLLREGCLPESVSLKDSVHQQFLALVRALHRSTGDHDRTGLSARRSGPREPRGANVIAFRNADRGVRESASRMPTSTIGRYRRGGRQSRAIENPPTIGSRSMYLDNDSVTPFPEPDRQRRVEPRRHGEPRWRFIRLRLALWKNGLCAAGAAIATAVMVASALPPFDVTSTMASLARAWLRGDV